MTPCNLHMNPNALLLRDETASTIHRAFAQKMTQFPAPAVSLNISLVDQAKCLFVLLTCSGHFHPFPYMAQISLPKESGDFLICAVHALVLAFLANYIGSRGLMVQARGKYGEAIRATRRVLEETGKGKEEEVLMAVIVMDCFERLSREEEFGSEEPRHLNGAIALCKFRGEKQFEDAVGKEMFHHLPRSVLWSCLERRIAVLEDYMELRDQAAPFVAVADVDCRAEKFATDPLSFRWRLLGARILRMRRYESCGGVLKKSTEGFTYFFLLEAQRKSMAVPWSMRIRGEEE